MSRAAGTGERRRGALSPVTLVDLLNAPELAVLELLDHAVHVARLALVAQHPHLLGDEHGRPGSDADPIAQRAAEILDCAFALARAVRGYRRAIDHSATLRDDDFPF
ncbi:MAG: hypothetical protein ACLP1X_24705 [Polyangiaceae bacterium]